MGCQDDCLNVALECKDDCLDVALAGQGVSFDVSLSCQDDRIHGCISGMLG